MFIANIHILGASQLEESAARASTGYPDQNEGFGSFPIADRSCWSAMTLNQDVIHCVFSSMLYWIAVIVQRCVDRNRNHRYKVEVPAQTLVTWYALGD
jgi:hypothetical protein